MSDLIHKLADKTRVPLPDVERIVTTAPRRYKVYTIPKRGGGRRLIAHPARELKALQRALVELSPPVLKVHTAATAYERGASIASNAGQHVSNAWVAKFDLKDFFNSIDVHAWKIFLQSVGASADYTAVSSNIFFWRTRGRASKLCLSVGAPSSPFASNRYMYPVDARLVTFCSGEGMTYTRYADDITISAPHKFDLTSVRENLRSALEGTPLVLNEQKTIMLGPGERRVVTGIVLSNDGNISLGRKRKREIEAMVYNFSRGTAEASLNQIRGHLSLLKMVDPAGYDRIRRKHSNLGALFKSD